MKRAAILLALPALLAAVVVPHLVTSLRRSRQKRTMADIRIIAAALEARADDLHSFSLGAGGKVGTAALAAALEPKYVKHLPRADGWGREFQLVVSADEYSIRSLGSDGRPDRDPTAFRGATTDLADDIVYSNGAFLQYPQEAG